MSDTSPRGSFTPKKTAGKAHNLVEVFIESLIIIGFFIATVYFLKQILESPDDSDKNESVTKNISSYWVKEKLLSLQKAQRKPLKKYKRESISTEVMIEVWERDVGHCVYCGSDERLEYDHIIPVSKGGANTAKNIQLLCQKCNLQKHAKIE